VAVFTCDSVAASSIPTLHTNPSLALQVLAPSESSVQGCREAMEMRLTSSELAGNVSASSGFSGTSLSFLSILPSKEERTGFSEWMCVKFR
jgi:hypothetical protein